MAIILPCWIIARTAHKNAGSHLFPAVRPGPDHAHMAPKLLGHLKANDFESKPDVFGRKSAVFYRNFFRQEMDGKRVKRKLVDQFNKHGFGF